jgi:HEAT repeat protein
VTHSSDSGETGKDEDTGTSIIRGFVGARKSLVVVVGLVLLTGCGTKSPIEGKSAAELEAMLRGGDVTAQAQGALGLSKLGPEAAPAVPALIDALKSQQALVRQNAALALGNIGSSAKAAVPGLTDALRDPEWAVRRQAAVALGQLGPDAKSAVPALQRLTRDPSGPVNKAAKEALQRVGKG